MEGGKREVEQKGGKGNKKEEEKRRREGGRKEGCITEVIDISPLAVLIPTCASSSPAFLMMYLVYKLNKQGDNIQP